MADTLAVLTAQLSNIPWCAAILSNAANHVEIPTSRRPKTNGEDTFFNRTLNTPSTLSAFVIAYPKGPTPRSRVDEVQGIFTLGDGFNGHVDVCHGGIVTTILDEMMGLVVVANLDRGAIPGPAYMTAYLNTTFLGPVKAHSTVLARARIARLHGRKLFMEETLEDGAGNVLAKAEGLFVRLKENL